MIKETNRRQRRVMPGSPAILGMVLAVVCAGAGCAVNRSSAGEAPVVTAKPIPVDVQPSTSAIRFLEDRVRRDPDDFIAYNKLAGYYLQRQRETGSVEFLTLASKAAQASLAAMPAEMNKGGLAALAQAEFASHEFARARDRATQLAGLDGGKAYPYEILGDALSELGDYDAAATAFRKMAEIGGRSVGIETRLARSDLLHGDTAGATNRLALALALASSQEPPSRESIAWIRWQLGEAAFAAGDYARAEQAYRDSLTTFPDYYRALAGLGRALAAQGDLDGAMRNYERAVSIIPDPAFVAALGDLYQIAGREREAEAQYALVEHIGKLNAVNGILYNRQIALFLADHDLKPEEAYNQAAREYGDRRDIYGADALAWTALKAGKTSEAQAAIKEALRLGTRDPRLFYHAGMIALAANDVPAARDYLQRTLDLSPNFDPLQASRARRALEKVGEPGAR